MAPASDRSGKGKTPVVVPAETRTDPPGDVGFRDRPFNFNSDFFLAVIIYYRPSTRPTQLCPIPSLPIFCVKMGRVPEDIDV
jgi:hypothetical protein